MKEAEDRIVRLEPSYSGAVYDVLRGMGYPGRVLPFTIKPLVSTWKVVGPVYPVEGRPVENLDAHESLLQWTGMLSKVPSGHVAVCQPNDSSLSHMGELSAETFKKRGVLGYIVDGGCRDTDFITRIEFPVCCRYTTPVDIVGRWRAEVFGEPIEIGGVRIRRDDWIFADRDGTIVIPGEVIDAVVEEVERVMNTENKVRTGIMEGDDPRDAYLKYGKF